MNASTTEDYTTKAGRGAVFAAFRARGTTARAWATKRGWKQGSVYLVIREWVEHPLRAGKMPHGGLNRAIILDLREELGADLVPVHGLDAKGEQAA